MRRARLRSLIESAVQAGRALGFELVARMVATGKMSGPISVCQRHDEPTIARKLGATLRHIEAQPISSPDRRCELEPISRTG